MQHIDIRISEVGDPPLFPELQEFVKAEAVITHCGILDQGTQSGKASLMFYFQMPDGSCVTAQMTAAMLHGLNSAVLGAEQRFAEKVKGN